jgi:hypothetical protein
MNTWKTKDGTVLKLRDMTPQHLLNTRAMLLRQAAALLEEFVSRKLPGEVNDTDTFDDCVVGGCDPRRIPPL